MNLWVLADYFMKIVCFFTLFENPEIRCSLIMKIFKRLEFLEILLLIHHPTLVHTIKFQIDYERFCPT
jgi:hypothetical protein